MKYTAIALLSALLVACEPSDKNQIKQLRILELDELQSWLDHEERSDQISAIKASKHGGFFDLMGNGGLMLSKKSTDKSLCRTGEFQKNGSWQSKWMSINESIKSLDINYNMIVYGSNQDMSTGWKKFDGNPVTCEHGWKLASNKSLQLPKTTGGRPNDQSIVRGRGEFEGKWLLIFNIDAWAAKGWGMLVADSLSPLKRGINPFKLIEDKFILSKGTEGFNAPNDWIEIDGTWYAPDESRDHKSHMWTSKDLFTWTDQGVIDSLNGHDPGMCFDSEYYYLFNENDHEITYCRSKDPLGKWEDMGVALKVGGHTGDADLSFFNNNWYMTFDNGPHGNYEIGIATTSPDSFPLGWKPDFKFYGPHKPEQNQKWDDDTEEGNEFGTGDADLALEGTTLYLTHERPIGMAWKDLEVLDSKSVEAELIIEEDITGNGTPDNTRRFELLTGIKTIQAAYQDDAPKKVRIKVIMSTSDAHQSPLINWLRIDQSMN